MRPVPRPGPRTRAALMVLTGAALVVGPFVVPSSAQEEELIGYLGVADSDAIAPARTIDGSNRVRLTNREDGLSVTTHRHHGRKTRNNGAAAINTNDTFCPDTAVRCDRPLARNRSIISRG